MKIERAQTTFHTPSRIYRQKGVVLFFTLIALVVMSLAALALVRSVDTGAMVAGNMAFKQSATTSADAGVEAAIAWLEVVNRANAAKNVILDPSHAFNKDDPANGYYSSLDSNLNVFGTSGLKHISWDNSGGDNMLLGRDRADNEVRYIIQRICRVANVIAQDAGCLYSADMLQTNSKAVQLPSEYCNSTDCPFVGQSPQYVITVRVLGPRDTISFVQSFAY